MDRVQIFTAVSGGRFRYSSNGIVTSTAGFLDFVFFVPGFLDCRIFSEGNRVFRSGAGGEVFRERKRGAGEGEKMKIRGTGKQEVSGTGNG